MPKQQGTSKWIWAFLIFPLYFSSKTGLSWYQTWCNNASPSFYDSESLWRNSVVRRHQYMDALQQRTKAELKLFPTLESDPGALYHVWEFFPPSYNCPWDMQRVGLFGDGGKWICGMSLYESATTRPLVVYSFGIAYESSFEQEMLERTNAYIFGYDYTVDSFGPEITSDYQNRTIMKKFGIGSKDIPGDPPFFTLQSLMKQNNHSYIDILKMDIEGDEFAVLTSFMDGFIGQQLPIGQVLIEIHLFQEHTTLKDFTIWWERLEDFGLRPVWAEANLLAVTYGGVLPCCTEV